VHLARRVEGLSYQERGELTLKGIVRPVRAWAVRTTAASAAPAAVVSDAAAGSTAVSDVQAGKGITQVASPLHNLPTALSSFVGREHARTRSCAMLGTHRMVTLVGVGKTRLALAVGQILLAGYPDGVWLVELASLADAGLVPGAVMAAMGLREDPVRPALDTLSDHCKGKRLLLVLDNCERLVAAAALRTAMGTPLNPKDAARYSRGGRLCGSLEPGCHRDYRLRPEYAVDTTKKRRHDHPVRHPHRLVAVSDRSKYRR
jgi:hypothetical protein